MLRLRSTSEGGGANPSQTESRTREDETEGKQQVEEKKALTRHRLAMQGLWIAHIPPMVDYSPQWAMDSLPSKELSAHPPTPPNPPLATVATPDPFASLLTSPFG